jgi:hypothetical protein
MDRLERGRQPRSFRGDVALRFDGADALADRPLRLLLGPASGTAAAASLRESSPMGPLPVGPDLIAITAEIVSSERTESEWAAVESDDMFQHGPYVGGFDADERAFVFSYRGGTGELWFQFTLAEARAIASGGQATVSARSPDT